MKKLFIVLLSLLMVLSLVGCSQKKEVVKMTPGTYTAVSTGFKGDIEVSVTVSEDKIENIEVLNHHETNGIGSEAMPYMSENMLKYQTVNVDSCAGATVTSAGFRMAVKDALSQAGADMEIFNARLKRVKQLKKKSMSML